MAAVAIGEPADVVARRRTFRQRWYRTPAFVAGLAIIGAMVAAALAAPLITGYDPNGQDLLHAYAHPSGAHWLGTDQLGRDVLTRLIFAEGNHRHFHAGNSLVRDHLAGRVVVLESP